MDPDRPIPEYRPPTTGIQTYDYPFTNTPQPIGMPLQVMRSIQTAGEYSQHDPYKPFYAYNIRDFSDVRELKQDMMGNPIYEPDMVGKEYRYWNPDTNYHGLTFIVKSTTETTTPLQSSLPVSEMEFISGIDPNLQKDSEFLKYISDWTRLTFKKDIWEIMNWEYVDSQRLDIQNQLAFLQMVVDDKDPYTGDPLSPECRLSAHEKTQTRNYMQTIQFYDLGFMFLKSVQGIIVGNPAMVAYLIGAFENSIHIADKYEGNIFDKAAVFYEAFNKRKDQLIIGGLITQGKTDPGQLAMDIAVEVITLKFGAGIITKATQGKVSGFHALGPDTIKAFGNSRFATNLGIKNTHINTILQVNGIYRAVTSTGDLVSAPLDFKSGGIYSFTPEGGVPAVNAYVIKINGVEHTIHQKTHAHEIIAYNEALKKLATYEKSRLSQLNLEYIDLGDLSHNINSHYWEITNKNISDATLARIMVEYIESNRGISYDSIRAPHPNAPTLSHTLRFTLEYVQKTEPDTFNQGLKTIGSRSSNLKAYFDPEYAKKQIANKHSSAYLDYEYDPETLQKAAHKLNIESNTLASLLNTKETHAFVIEYAKRMGKPYPETAQEIAHLFPMAIEDKVTRMRSYLQTRDRWGNLQSSNILRNSQLTETEFTNVIYSNSLATTLVYYASNDPALLTQNVQSTIKTVIEKQDAKSILKRPDVIGEYGEVKDIIDSLDPQDKGRNLIVSMINEGMIVPESLIIRKSIDIRNQEALNQLEKAGLKLKKHTDPDFYIDLLFDEATAIQTYIDVQRQADINNPMKGAPETSNYYLWAYLYGWGHSQTAPPGFSRPYSLTEQHQMRTDLSRALPPGTSIELVEFAQAKLSLIGSFDEQARIVADIRKDVSQLSDQSKSNFYVAQILDNHGIGSTEYTNRIRWSEMEYAGATGGYVHGSSVSGQALSRIRLDTTIFPPTFTEFIKGNPANARTTISTIEYLAYRIDTDAGLSNLERYSLIKELETAANAPTSVQSYYAALALYRYGIIDKDIVNTHYEKTARLEREGSRNYVPTPEVALQNPVVTGKVKLVDLQPSQDYSTTTHRNLVSPSNPLRQSGSTPNTQLVGPHNIGKTGLNLASNLQEIFIRSNKDSDTSLPIIPNQKIIDSQIKAWEKSRSGDIVTQDIIDTGLIARSYFTLMYQNPQSATMIEAISSNYNQKFGVPQAGEPALFPLLDAIHDNYNYGNIDLQINTQIEISQEIRARRIQTGSQTLIDNQLMPPIATAGETPMHIGWYSIANIQDFNQHIIDTPKTAPDNTIFTRPSKPNREGVVGTRQYPISPEGLDSAYADYLVVHEMIRRSNEEMQEKSFELQEEGNSLDHRRPEFADDEGEGQIQTSYIDPNDLTLNILSAPFMESKFAENNKQIVTRALSAQGLVPNTPEWKAAQHKIYTEYYAQQTVLDNAKAEYAGKTSIGYDTGLLPRGLFKFVDRDGWADSVATERPLSKQEFANYLSTQYVRVNLYTGEVWHTDYQKSSAYPFVQSPDSTNTAATITMTYLDFLRYDSSLPENDRFNMPWRKFEQQDTIPDNINQIIEANRLFATHTLPGMGKGYTQRNRIQSVIIDHSEFTQAGNPARFNYNKFIESLSDHTDDSNILYRNPDGTYSVITTDMLPHIRQMANYLNPENIEYQTRISNERRITFDTLNEIKFNQGGSISDTQTITNIQTRLQALNEQLSIQEQTKLNFLNALENDDPKAYDIIINQQEMSILSEINMIEKIINENPHILKNPNEYTSQLGLLKHYTLYLTSLKEYETDTQINAVAYPGEAYFYRANQLALNSLTYNIEYAPFSHIVGTDSSPFKTDARGEYLASVDTILRNSLNEGNNPQTLATIIQSGLFTTPGTFDTQAYTNAYNPYITATRDSRVGINALLTDTTPSKSYTDTMYGRLLTNQQLVNTNAKYSFAEHYGSITPTNIFYAKLATDTSQQNHPLYATARDWYQSNDAAKTRRYMNHFNTPKFDQLAIEGIYQEALRLENIKTSIGNNPDALLSFLLAYTRNTENIPLIEGIIHKQTDKTYYVDPLSTKSRKVQNYDPSTSLTLEELQSKYPQLHTVSNLQYFTYPDNANTPAPSRFASILQPEIDAYEKLMSDQISIAEFQQHAISDAPSLPDRIRAQGIPDIESVIDMNKLSPEEQFNIRGLKQTLASETDQFTFTELYKVYATEYYNLYKKHGGNSEQYAIEKTVFETDLNALTAKQNINRQYRKNAAADPAGRTKELSEIWNRFGIPQSMNDDLSIQHIISTSKDTPRIVPEGYDPNSKYFLHPDSFTLSDHPLPKSFDLQFPGKQDTKRLGPIQQDTRTGINWDTANLHKFTGDDYQYTQSTIPFDPRDRDAAQFWAASPDQKDEKSETLLSKLLDIIHDFRQKIIPATSAYDQGEIIDYSLLNTVSTNTTPSQPAQTPPSWYNASTTHTTDWYTAQFESDPDYWGGGGKSASDYSQFMAKDTSNIFEEQYQDGKIATIYNDRSYEVRTQRGQLAGGGSAGAAYRINPFTGTKYEQTLEPQTVQDLEDDLDFTDTISIPHETPAVPSWHTSTTHNVDWYTNQFKSDPEYWGGGGKSVDSYTRFMAKRDDIVNEYAIGDKILTQYSDNSFEYRTETGQIAGSGSAGSFHEIDHRTQTRIPRNIDGTDQRLAEIKQIRHEIAEYLLERDVSKMYEQIEETRTRKVETAAATTTQSAGSQTPAQSPSIPMLARRSQPSPTDLANNATDTLCSVLNASITAKGTLFTSGKSTHVSH